jgi:NAD-dependent dihydropyrimidine dehydrogenase PreA subunit
MAMRGVRRPDGEELVEVTIEPRYRRELDYEAIPRQKPRTRPLRRRIGIAEVEECFDEATARREARRCLQCWTNTIFDSDRAAGTECVLCGGCQDVCPESCIEILPASRFGELGAGARELAPLLRGGERVGAVFVKDEEVCIRCGLCAARCPAGTITMQSFAIRR